MSELRLIGKDRGNNSAEHIADAFLVSFMSNFDKSVYCLFVHCVNVCIAIVSRRFKRRLVVSIPNLTNSFAFILDHLVGCERTLIVENYIILSNEFSATRAGGLGLFVTDMDLSSYFFIGVGSKEKIINSILRIFGN